MPFSHFVRTAPTVSTTGIRSVKLSMGAQCFSMLCNFTCMLVVDGQLLFLVQQSKSTSQPIHSNWIWLVILVYKIQHSLHYSTTGLRGMCILNASAVYTNALLCVPCISHVTCAHHTEQSIAVHCRIQCSTES